MMRKRNQEQNDKHQLNKNEEVSKSTRRSENLEKVNEKESREVNENAKSKPYKYGPMPRFSGQKMWSKLVVVTGVVLYVWYFSNGTKDAILARQDKMYPGRGQHVDCSPEYIKEISQYPGCVPNKCGRYVSDKVISSHEASSLLRLAKRGMALGGSTGGATILDLHSGAISYGDKFINIYKHPEKFITPADIALYKVVRMKIQNLIADTFGIDKDSLFLTHPTFFSKLTNAEPKTPHDEYWHIHIDKHTYESFHYTSLLYLGDYGKDFKGGRFFYLDDADNPKRNVTVEPRKGRVSFFTSGEENPHFVERVTEGERFAITVSFTCDKSKAINDPLT